MNTIIQKIRQDLKKNSDAETKATGQNYFKEKIKLYGVKTPTVGKIAKNYLPQIKDLDEDRIFELCENLWKSGYIEEAFVACEWSYCVREQFKPEDFKILEKWVSQYVDNWASCDTLCNHTIGAFVEMYPDYLSNLKDWAKSKNRWIRRASAVSLIIPARRGKFLKDIFEIADILLQDMDDLVQKGYGWMLKAASQVHQKQVFDYVMKNKTVMPRMALRYAIEKMPKSLKQKAMEK